MLELNLEIAFIAPPDHWSSRCKQRVQSRLTQWAGQNRIKHYSDDAFKRVELEKQNPQSIVFYAGFERSRLPKTDARLYQIDASGVITPYDGMLNEADYPERTKTTFGRLGGARTGEFKYFPYGLMGVHTGRGALDALGFRINGQFTDLIDRAKDHKVVAVFGGSTAFSTHCFDPETFSSRLQDILIEKGTQEQTKQQFSVLNFGQVGAVSLHNMITWMLYCVQLKPELVICHGGWNDLCLGLGCDPVLLSEHQICYLYQFEDWAKKLHGTDVVTANPARPLKNINYPEDVVDAWYARVLQFSKMVVSHGSNFILGLQPAASSKSSQHPNEKATIEAGANNGDLMLAFEKMPAMLDMASRRLAEHPQDFEQVLDFHKAFGRYDSQTELFADRVHCWPEGDEIIAQLYAELAYKVLKA